MGVEPIERCLQLNTVVTVNGELELLLGGCRAWRHHLTARHCVERGCFYTRSFHDPRRPILWPPTLSLFSHPFFYHALNSSFNIKFGTISMATVAVDTAYISASYNIPEPSIQTLLDSPTVELVQSLLAQVESKAREYDNLKAEKLRADIELENAVRGGEAQRSSLKASFDRALSEVEELRRKLNEEGTRD